MSRFDELKGRIEKHPAVQEAAPRQHAVLATARMIYNWRRAAGLSQLELAKAISAARAKTDQNFPHYRRLQKRVDIVL